MVVGNCGYLLGRPDYPCDIISLLTMEKNKNLDPEYLLSFDGAKGFLEEYNKETIAKSQRKNQFAQSDTCDHKTHRCRECSDPSYQ